MTEQTTPEAGGAVDQGDAGDGTTTTTQAPAGQGDPFHPDSPRRGGAGWGTVRAQLESGEPLPLGPAHHGYAVSGKFEAPNEADLEDGE